jgi:hypothetical protein
MQGGGSVEEADATMASKSATCALGSSRTSLNVVHSTSICRRPVVCSSVEHVDFAICLPCSSYAPTELAPTICSTKCLSHATIGC